MGQIVSETPTPTSSKPAPQTVETAPAPVAHLQAPATEAAIPSTPPVPPVAPPPASPMPGAFSQWATIPEPGKERILLVEDQLTNRLVVENMLENIQLKTTHAENGKEAVAKFREAEFDLVLMDVQMPVMNGYDATKEIRILEQQQQRPRTPIIAVTANAMQGDRQKCLEAGMDDYIAKPIQAAELEQMVRKYLAVAIDAKKTDAS